MRGSCFAYHRHTLRWLDRPPRQGVPIPIENRQGIFPPPSRSSVLTIPSRCSYFVLMESRAMIPCPGGFYRNGTANRGRLAAATVSSFIVKRPSNDEINRSLASLRIDGNAALHSVFEAKVFRCTKIRPSGIVSKYTFSTALNLPRIANSSFAVPEFRNKPHD